MGRSSLYLLFVGILFTGCATTLPTISELEQVPEERRFAHQTSKEGGAVLTVLRDKAFTGGGVDYRLFVDGKLSAQLAWGEFVVLYVLPGERVIEVRHPSALLGAIGDSTTLRAEPDGKYFYRINSDIGQIRILRTTEDSIKYTGKVAEWVYRADSRRQGNS